MGLRRQVHAINRGAPRPGQQVGVQKPHAGQVFQHRLQLGGDAGTPLMTTGAHLLTEFQLVILHRAERSVSFDGYKTPILDTVTSAIRDFIAPHDAPALAGIGVSATGQIDSRRGVVAGTCGNFPGWIGVDIKGTLEREFGLPVTVANDANCMLLGEVWAGAAKGYTDVIGVTLGTGVGGGILIGGGVSAQQELLIDPLAEKVRASVMPAFAEGLELKSAALQNDAGLVGAVYYFKKHHD